MTDAEDQLASLMRTLRRYSDTSLGRKLAVDLYEFADQAKAGMTAMEKGSDERQVEMILVVVFRRLADLILNLGIEIGTARIEAREWLDDIDPDDFGPSSFGESP